LNKDNNQPPEITPAESGASSDGQNSNLIVAPSITETTIPLSPIGEQLTELADQGSSAFGGRFGTRMTAAAFQQLEQTNDRQASEIQKKETRIDELQKENTDLKINLTKANSASETQQKTAWIMAGIFALSSLLLSIGYDDWQTRDEFMIFTLGCLTFVLGLSYPLWGRK
jgi:hypothetical protein